MDRKLPFADLKNDNLLILRLSIQPRSSAEEFCGIHGDRLRVRLNAPPVDGRANKALLLFLAKELKIPRSAIRLLSGEKSRLKSVEVFGSDVQNIFNKLLEFLD